MKLNVNFDLLDQAVRQMGAEPVAFSLKCDMQQPRFTVDTELSGAGKEVTLDELEYKNDLLSYDGHQVLLYIPDHGHKVSEVLKNSEKGNKFHVADCSKLDEMRRHNRFSRYRATNNISGVFEIFGHSVGEPLAGEAKLQVCKLCLSKLNYKGAGTGSADHRRALVARFELSQFFLTYMSLFKQLPKMLEDNPTGYTEDWPEVSAGFRARAGFRCESCHVDLRKETYLLHTHHINGDKCDNAFGNLKSLCADCHRKEPFHNHMFVSRQDTAKIVRYRQEQNLPPPKGWLEIKHTADPAVIGIIEWCEKRGFSMPIVGQKFNIKDRIKYAELAWPDQKIAVTLGSTFECSGWNVMALSAAMQYFSDRAATKF